VGVLDARRNGNVDKQIRCVSKWGMTETVDLSELFNTTCDK